MNNVQISLHSVYTCSD